MPDLAGHVPGILRHPMGVGFLAVTGIAVFMLFMGTNLVAQDFIGGVEAQQTQQVAHLSQAIHISGLVPDDREQARESLAEVAASDQFDNFIKQSIYGLEIARLDLYDLVGNRIYTTAPESVAISADDTPPYVQARRGFPTSEIQTGMHVTNIDGRSTDADVLATFGLIEDSAPLALRGGRPLAVLAVYGEVGENLTSIKTTIRYIVGVFIGGLGVIFVIVYRVSEASRRRLQDANDELQRQYTKVRESRERMLTADEAAKRAIAEELHGAVQTKLYAVWMKLGSAAQLVRKATQADDGSGDSKSADEIDSIAEIVDNIREEDIRKLSHRLHPGIVRVGALAGLRSLRDSFEEMLNIDMQVGEAAERLESGGSSEIPEQIRLAAYRIAELALANVAKHAQATQVVLGWDHEPDARALVLRISDDGKGFDSDVDDIASRPTGIGLVTMGDYAEALRGSLKITSTPGIGTELSAKFPFRIDDSNLDDNGPHSATTGNVLADPKARGAVRFAEENSVD